MKMSLHPPASPSAATSARKTDATKERRFPLPPPVRDPPRIPFKVFCIGSFSPAFYPIVTATGVDILKTCKHLLCQLSMK